LGKKSALFGYLILPSKWVGLAPFSGNVPLQHFL
jgi:hypothetical protein